MLALEEGTKLPADSPMYVHNLSAVGEQYLDFEPADDEAPYVEDGDRLEGTEDSLPTDEADLLVELNDFVGSVDEENLQVVVAELGTMFDDTGEPLQQLLDNGSRFVDEASAHSDETIALLDNGLTVLGTQQDNAENIASFSRDLNLLTAALAASDQDLRQVLQGTPGTARELDALLTDLEPTLPVFLGNAMSLNQVAVGHLAGLEQLLVSFPRVIGGGPTRQHRRRLRTRQPAVRRRPGVHRRLPQAERVAPVQRPLRRPDLPGEVQQRATVQHARHEVRARDAAQQQPGTCGRRFLRPADRACCPAWSTRTATRCATSTPATSPCSAGTRGSGSWWVRFQ